MIDIRLLRSKSTRELVKKSEENRFKDPSVVEKIYELDQKCIKLQFEIDTANKEININNKEISQALKNNKEKENKSEIIKRLTRLDLKETKELKMNEVLEIEKNINQLLNSIGNILHQTVPIAKTDEGNVTIRTFLDEKCTKKSKSYSELMEKYTNSKIGSKVVGHRGYFLQGKMAELGFALKSYAIRFLTKNKFTYIQTPVMLQKDVMGKTAQLSDFDDQLYEIKDGLYLIATSEQPLTTLYMNSRLLDKDLPISYAGDSLCFRKEAGSYGKDNSGLFRVHQFDKVEQFVICSPEDSEEWHAKMVKISEEFLQSLKLPYRVISIASGELNDAASYKYDIEAWFPSQQKYRELVSASNCTDYQSRNLEIYYGYSSKSSDNKPVFVHMLNATLCAVQRTLCCVVENYWNENGKIIVPEVLKPYLDFEEFDY